MQKTCHAIERTNQKGKPLVGRCIKCGAIGLTAEDARKECPNTRGMADDQVLVTAILGPSEMGAQ
jgi:hypothetical protein